MRTILPNYGIIVARKGADPMVERMRPETPRKEYRSKWQGARRRVAVLLLFLGAGLALVQPCVAGSGDFDITGASPRDAINTRRRCCPMAGC
jgi:hypothetical protein